MLTESQKMVLEFIRSHREATGEAPSYRQIQSHFGYRAVGTVQDHVRALIKKGYLEKSHTRRQAHGLVIKGSRSTFDRPSFQRPKAQDSFFGETFHSPPVSHTFGFSVQGDWMIDMGILPGDHLLVEPCSQYQNGDIVVVVLNGQTSVQKYLGIDGEVFLVPENKNLKPVKVQGVFSIQGRVVGLQRNYHRGSH